MKGKLLNRLTKRFFYYEIKYAYKDENGRMIFDFVMVRGLWNKSAILDNKQAKYKVNEFMYSKSAARELLCNGYVTILRTCYLGWLKPLA